VQWGEIAGKLRKRLGASDETRILSSLLPSEAKIVPVTADRAVHSADIKVDRNIGYADSFAVDLAMDSPDHVLVTADYGFKAVDDLARIEFLPAK
jgi:predicted nucleic acid-binding protein